MNLAEYYDQKIIKTGAVDLDDCRRNYFHNCTCNPVCGRCGCAKHTAVHGPIAGQPPGSKPWGHEYTPEQEQSK